MVVLVSRVSVNYPLYKMPLPATEVCTLSILASDSELHTAMSMNLWVGDFREGTDIVHAYDLGVGVLDKAAEKFGTILRFSPVLCYRNTALRG